MQKITDKRIGTQLYGEGFFGNTLRQWYDVASLEAASPEPCKVVLRQRQAEGGGVCLYNLTIPDAAFWHDQFTCDGEKNLYFGEQLVNQPHNMILQGEYYHHHGLEQLRYNTEKLFMRDAMERCSHASGPTCKLILKQFLDLASYENMMTMADCYPNHVIEFSVADEPIGHLGHNTILWEVRLY